MWISFCFIVIMFLASMKSSNNKIILSILCISLPRPALTGHIFPIQFQLINKLTIHLGELSLSEVPLTWNNYDPRSWFNLSVILQWNSNLTTYWTSTWLIQFAHTLKSKLQNTCFILCPFISPVITKIYDKFDTIVMESYNEK